MEHSKYEEQVSRVRGSHRVSGPDVLPMQETLGRGCRTLGSVYIPRGTRTAVMEALGKLLGACGSEQTRHGYSPRRREHPSTAWTSKEREGVEELVKRTLVWSETWEMEVDPKKSGLVILKRKETWI
ncbi:MAG: uncharacterized protein A8A55_3615 [Amphiamblys sp. WSBS2006]|nr:MAG: uncharacterized protein A8A55_3615 [Amphiamblys sp. WSBS2006]